MRVHIFVNSNSYTCAAPGPRRAGRVDQMQRSQRGRQSSSMRRGALTRREVLAGSLAGTLGLGLAARRVRADGRPTQPNIVFLLADDLGYADLSCYGRNFQTPRIDSLARNGALFTQA